MKSGVATAPSPASRRGSRWVLLVVIGVIAFSTLRPAPSQADRAAETAWSCLVCGDAGVTDVLLNLLLFAPLGAVLRRLGLSWRRTLLAALAYTFAIETAQATLLAGRDASAGDLLANSLGAAGGWWLVPLLHRFRRPSPRQARETACVLWGVSSALWVMSGWGLHPAGSTDGPWVGQPGRVWAGHATFPGTLAGVTLNGIAVPNDPLASPPVLEQQVALDVAFTRSDASTPRRPVSLVRIVDAAGALQVSAAQRGEALLVSVRVRAARWRVRTPTWRHDDAMRTPPGVPSRLQWSWDATGVSLVRGPTDGPALMHSTFTPSIGLGWVFVHPFAAAISQDALWWTALWLACWTLPFAWCLRWVSRREAAIGTIAALASFMGASLLTGMPVRWEEVSLMCVLLLGAAVRRRRKVVNGER